MALNPRLKVLTAMAILALVAACGTGREDPAVLAAREVFRAFGQGGDTAPAPVFTAASVPPELVAQLPRPLMLLEVPTAEGSSALVRVGTNAGDATWRGPNGIGLTLDAQGVVISSRGFGFDLMASDARPTAAALASRQAGTVQRGMVHLDGEGRQVSRSFTCTLQQTGREPVTIAGRARPLDRVTETCTGVDGYAFRNIYWTDPSGRMVQSDQWISSRIGSVRVTVLSE